MSLPTSSPPTSEEPRNWWQRNWMWFLPVGCLSVMTLLLGFVVVLDPSRNRVIDKSVALNEEGRLRLPDGFAPTVFATIPTEPGMEPGTYTLSVVIRDRQAGRRTVRNTIFTLQ